MNILIKKIRIKKYEEFGKGELSALDVEDFVKEVFNINMRFYLLNLSS